jgi:hypothetical protein
MHCTGRRGPSTTTAPGPSHSSSTSRSRCRLSGVINALPWAVDSDGNFVNVLMTRRSYWHDEGSVLSFKFECWVSSFNGWRPGEGRSHTRFAHVCQLRADCLRDTGDTKNVNSQVVQASRTAEQEQPVVTTISSRKIQPRFRSEMVGFQTVPPLSIFL